MGNWRHLLGMTAPSLSVMAALSVFLMPAMLSSCSVPANSYAEYAELPSEGWKYGDTVWFEPTHPDSLCRGRLAVGIRHENDFPYTSLWLETTIEEVAGQRTDTLELILADSFGRWTGRGIGTSFQAIDTIAVSFLHHSESRIGVRHIMKADTLCGVSQVGIFFLPEQE